MRNITFRKSFVISLILMGLPVIAVAGPSIGDMAKNIFAPTEILTKLLLVSCYVIGTGLIFASLAQYRIHRQSPKLVPLTTPILLLVLGIICVLIPYSTQLFGESYSAVDQAEKEGLNRRQNVLPLPDVNKKGPLLPTAPRPAPQDEPAPADSSSGRGESYEAPADTTPSSTGSGHWTDDPKYNN